MAFNRGMVVGASIHKTHAPCSIFFVLWLIIAVVHRSPFDFGGMVIAGFHIWLKGGKKQAGNVHLLNCVISSQQCFAYSNVCLVLASPAERCDRSSFKVGVAHSVLTALKYYSGLYFLQFGWWRLTFIGNGFDSYVLFGDRVTGWCCV